MDDEREIRNLQTPMDLQAGPAHRPASQVVGNAFGIYTTLKVGVLFWQGYKDAQARGATDGEAVEAGATQAGAWIGFLCLTIGLPFFTLLLPAVQIANYYGKFHPELTNTTPVWFLWTVVIILGGGSMIAQVTSWLVLYSKLKDKLRTKKGRVYQLGFRIRRRFFLMTPWWMFVMIIFLANLPMNVAFTIRPIFF